MNSRLIDAILRAVGFLVLFVFGFLAFTQSPTPLGPSSAALVRATRFGDTVEVFVDRTGQLVMQKRERCDH